MEILWSETTVCYLAYCAVALNYRKSWGGQNLIT